MRCRRAGRRTDAQPPPHAAGAHSWQRHAGPPGAPRLHGSPAVHDSAGRRRSPWRLVSESPVSQPRGSGATPLSAQRRSPLALASPAAAHTSPGRGRWTGLPGAAAAAVARERAAASGSPLPRRRHGPRRWAAPASPAAPPAAVPTPVPELPAFSLAGAAKPAASPAAKPAAPAAPAFGAAPAAGGMFGAAGSALAFGAASTPAFGAGSGLSFGAPATSAATGALVCSVLCCLSWLLLPLLRAAAAVAGRGRVAPPRLPACRPGGAFFLPAAAWEGPKPGYVFKLDGSGLGYYKDRALPTAGSLFGALRSASVRRRLKHSTLLMLTTPAPPPACPPAGKPAHGSGRQLPSPRLPLRSRPCPAWRRRRHRRSCLPICPAASPRRASAQPPMPSLAQAAESQKLLAKVGVTKAGGAASSGQPPMPSASGRAGSAGAVQCLPSQQLRCCQQQRGGSTRGICASIWLWRGQQPWRPVWRCRACGVIRGGIARHCGLTRGSSKQRSGRPQLWFFQPRWRQQPSGGPVAAAGGASAFGKVLSFGASSSAAAASSSPFGSSGAAASSAAASAPSFGFGAAPAQRSSEHLWSSQQRGGAHITVWRCQQRSRLWCRALPPAQPPLVPRPPPAQPPLVPRPPPAVRLGRFGASPAASSAAASPFGAVGAFGAPQVGLGCSLEWLLCAYSDSRAA